jgi:hypothetical protein
MLHVSAAQEPAPVPHPPAAAIPPPARRTAHQTQQEHGEGCLWARGGDYDDDDGGNDACSTPDNSSSASACAGSRDLGTCIDGCRQELAQENGFDDGPSPAEAGYDCCSSADGGEETGGRSERRRFRR